MIQKIQSSPSPSFTSKVTMSYDVAEQLTWSLRNKFELESFQKGLKKLASNNKNDCVHITLESKNEKGINFPRLGIRVIEKDPKDNSKIYTAQGEYSLFNNDLEVVNVEKVYNDLKSKLKEIPNNFTKYLFGAEK